MTERSALYAGSFDPFTLGHMDVARKSARLFDRVVVLIGVNVRKTRRFPAEAMRDGIAAALRDEGLSNVEVVIFDGLVTDFCRGQGIGYYVRGIRTATDYAYEEDIARVNRMLCPELETIYLRADHPALSSSMVRELLAFGKDVSDYVPPAVLEHMQGL